MLERKGLRAFGLRPRSSEGQNLALAPAPKDPIVSNLFICVSTDVITYMCIQICTYTCMHIYIYICRMHIHMHIDKEICVGMFEVSETMATLGIWNR